MLRSAGWSIEETMRFARGGLFLSLINLAKGTVDTGHCEENPSPLAAPDHLNWVFMLATRLNGENSIFIQLTRSKQEEIYTPALSYHDASQPQNERVLRYKLIGAAEGCSLATVLRMIEKVQIPSGEWCSCRLWIHDCVRLLRRSTVATCSDMEEFEEEMTEKASIVLDDKENGCLRYGMISWLDCCELAGTY
ncbi:unnamed protein product [Somion occarium]|uniref:Uncharacterized protein n=1 Tax=Somion occarium TaxID=3059160 RepID=A0ABP1CSM0_9APHY